MDASTSPQAFPGQGRPESTLAGAGRYKRFPLRWGGLHLPVSSRELALHGLAMYPACRLQARLGVRLTRGWIRAFGVKTLLGRTVTWESPDAWKSLERTWSEQLGEFDGVAINRRVPSTRPGVAMLLARGSEPIAFVKCRKQGEDLAREREALELLARYGRTTFVAPEPIGFGTVEGWTWYAQSPVMSGPNRPPRLLDLGPTVAEIRLALADLPRSSSVPDHWHPMHGDFTPWNFRAVKERETPVLVDWENAGWVPPGADQVLYRAVEKALGWDTSKPPEGVDEAIEYWRRDIASWGRTGRDERLAEGVRAALLAWREEASS